MERQSNGQKRTKIQTMTYKTLHRKLMIEIQEQKTGINKDVPEE
jgi:hypothetical protein